EAREAVDALLSDDTLSRELRLRVYAMAARLARVEGRFGERARFQEAARTGSLAPAPAAEEAPDLAARRAAAEAEVVELLGRRSMRVAPSGRLLAAVEYAAREGLDETLGALLDAAVARRLPPRVLYD